jgi:hypothetical protein
MTWHLCRSRTDTGNVEVRSHVHKPAPQTTGGDAPSRDRALRSVPALSPKRRPRTRYGIQGLRCQPHLEEPTNGLTTRRTQSTGSSTASTAAGAQQLVRSGLRRPKQDPAA